MNIQLDPWTVLVLGLLLAGQIGSQVWFIRRERAVAMLADIARRKLDMMAEAQATDCSFCPPPVCQFMVDAALKPSLLVPTVAQIRGNQQPGTATASLAKAAEKIAAGVPLDPEEIRSLIENERVKLAGKFAGILGEFQTTASRVYLLSAPAHYAFHRCWLLSQKQQQAVSTSTIVLADQLMIVWITAWAATEAAREAAKRMLSASAAAHHGHPARSG